MPKLNDIQTILLSTASQRESGSIFPLPEGTNSARSPRRWPRSPKAAW